MTELVHYSVDRGIARIELDSPHNRNALSRQLCAELDAHLTAAGSDSAVRAVELTHTGSVFCAGADLSEVSAGPSITEVMIGLLRRIVEMPKPVVARLDGHVRAGGLGLVGAADIAVASRTVTFAFTEVLIGVAPAMISLTTLGRMTERAASRYLLTGEVFDATAAAEVGLITAAVDDLDQATAAIHDQLRKCSPQGLAETKPLTTRTTLEAFENRAADLAALSARLFATDEAKEGMRAFLEKRSPGWVLD
ncbi:MAG: enoyl-CoA hydratase family protein [Mycobacteriaceae bacterium]